MSVVGFILQPTYRTVHGRAVIHLYGRLADGEPFLVHDDRERPAFYVAAEDADRAAALGARLAPAGQRTFDGRPAARVELDLPSAAPPLRDLLHKNGIITYEADLRFAIRYLLRRGLRGAVEIEGPSRERKGVGRVFDNPELRPAAWPSDAALRLLSIDIETDPRARRLLSIAIHGCGVSEVLLFCPEGYPPVKGALPFPTERELLGFFCRRVRELDPDVITGWNVVDFDLRVLVQMARNFGLTLALGRGRGNTRIRSARTAWSSSEAVIPGRVVLDGIALLRGAFIQMDSYSLDAVAREVLGEGKLMTGEAAGGDRAEEILDAFKHHRERFVAYNRRDAELVTEILDRLGLLDLAVQRSLLTGLAIDRVAGSVAAFDFLYLMELGRRGVVAPSVHRPAGEEGDDDGEVNLGGHVLEPEPGLHENVVLCDFKSLYPSLIRTFQIDPLGYVLRPAKGADLIRAPNGAAFKRRGGILPRLIDRLFPRREEAKAAGDKVTSHAIKILMNSFYGVLGTPACRFHRPAVAGAITAFGRELLLWSKKWLEDEGFRVLYGDTDSLFIATGRADPRAAEELGRDVVARLNSALAAHVRSRWQVESRLELEFERLYRRLLLFHTRRGRAGARKRYAGLVGEGEDAEVVFTGLEAVRRDWTGLAKQVQRELFERLFRDREVERYLKGVVVDLRAGRLDDLLVYRKGLRKPLAEYTATTPPHVAAARKMADGKIGGRRGRVISYVITRAGAEPAAERRSPIDYEHYVEKQVRPVAEPVLEVLGLEFARVIGDDAQLELFPEM